MFWHCCMISYVLLPFHHPHGDMRHGDPTDVLIHQNTSGKARTAVSPPADGSTNGNRVVTFLADLHDYDSPNALDRLKRANALSQYLDLEMRKASREAGLGEGYLRRVSV